MELNKIYQGDCLDVLPTLPDNSVDSIVTDPPYELGFMGKSWDNSGIAYNVDMWKECLRVLKPGGHLLSFSGTRTYHRMAVAIEDAGFEIRDMIEWVYSTGFPKSLNVYKHLQKKCKCGNMEVYENRIKQMGKDSEAETEYFLRFMQEADLSQTISPEKKQGKVLQSGLSEQSSHRTVQGEEPEESSKGREERVLERGNNTKKTEGKLQGSDLSEMPERVFSDGEERRIYNATQAGDGSAPKQTINENGSSASQGPQSEQQQYREPCAFCKQWGTQAIRTLGVGTATKPAHEPICMARKPLAEKTVAKNVLKYGTGGINVDGSRVGTEKHIIRGGGQFTKDGEKTFFPSDEINEERTGRFPANLIHDNSEEVQECFPETTVRTRKARTAVKGGCSGALGHFGGSSPDAIGTWPEDNGGNASRFFKSIIYQAKASKSERNKGCEGLEDKTLYEADNDHGNLGHFLVKKAGGDIGDKIVRKNHHPTVKPIALMEYLIKMITPPQGTVLDPFAGSGTTLIAAKKNGFNYIGIELNAEYIKIAEARLKAVQTPLL